MGCYDEVEIGKKCGQVKIWYSLLHTYKKGDEVLEVRGQKTYSIAMREEGFVNICDLKLESWTEKPAYSPVFDKWGRLYEQGKTTGQWGDAYTDTPLSPDRG